MSNNPFEEEEEEKEEEKEKERENNLKEEPINPFESDSSFEEKSTFKQNESKKNEFSQTFAENQKMENNMLVPPKITQQTSFSSFNNYIDNNWEKITPEELERKEKELKKREEELKNKEKNLLIKENEIKKKNRVKNWPSCKPIVYQDIEHDMPTPEGVSLVKKALRGWYGICLALIWNTIVLIALLVVSADAIGFLIGLIFFFLSIPISFGIFRLLYNAVRKSKSSYFFIYFILMWMSFLVYGWLGIGFDAWGGGGLFVFLENIGNNKTIGIFGLVDTALFALVIIWHIYVMALARKEYKKSGGNSKTKEELTQMAANEAVKHPDLIVKGSETFV